MLRELPFDVYVLVLLRILGIHSSTSTSDVPYNVAAMYLPTVMADPNPRDLMVRRLTAEWIEALNSYTAAMKLVYTRIEMWLEYSKPRISISSDNILLVSISYDMMTSLNGIIYRTTGPLCGEFTGHWWIPRPVMLGSDGFFDLRMNTRLSKQFWGWWFGTLSRSFWRHCNEDAG